MYSDFASPERSDRPSLNREIARVSDHPVMTGLLNMVRGVLAVLNRHRQILAANRAFLDMLEIDEADAVLGLRPGEVVSCEYAHESPSGCGTSKTCASCGAAIAIVTSLATSEPCERLCAIRTSSDVVRDIFLMVSAVPLAADGDKWVLLFLQDVTKQQQWAALERVFFHDLSNLAMGLRGNSEFLAGRASGESQELAREVSELSTRLASEVAMQRALLGNHGEVLKPNLGLVRVSDIVEEVQASFHHHPAAEGIDLEIRNLVPEVRVRTDRALALRVIANMLTNAFEATGQGGVVRLRVEQAEEHVAFFVWSQAAIPAAIVDRIFQRNFSSKNAMGRGLGTYSMKLFGEQVLGGRVSFSTGSRGTEFRFDLPR